MMPRNSLLHKKTQDPIIFAKLLTWPMVQMDFSEFVGQLTSKKNVIDSILRLNAWYHMKAEKISNQNIQDQLWAFFRKHIIFSAKLGQFETQSIHKFREN